MSISISLHNEIRHRAQEIFEERKVTGRDGDALSDWLEAEQELKSYGGLGRARAHWRPGQNLWPRTRMNLNAATP